MATELVLYCGKHRSTFTLTEEKLKKIPNSTFVAVKNDLGVEKYDLEVNFPELPEEKWNTFCKALEEYLEDKIDFLQYDDKILEMFDRTLIKDFLFLQFEDKKRQMIKSYELEGKYFDPNQLTTKETILFCSFFDVEKYHVLNRGTDVKMVFDDKGQILFLSQWRDFMACYVTYDKTLSLAEELYNYGTFHYMIYQRGQHNQITGTCHYDLFNKIKQECSKKLNVIMGPDTPVPTRTINHTPGSTSEISQERFEEILDIFKDGTINIEKLLLIVNKISDLKEANHIKLSPEMEEYFSKVKKPIDEKLIERVLEKALEVHYMAYQTKTYFELFGVRSFFA